MSAALPVPEALKPGTREAALKVAAEALRTQGASLIAQAGALEALAKADELASQPDRNMTIREVADELKLSPSEVRAAIKRRELRAERHGKRGWRIPRSELTSYRRRRLIK